MYKNNKYILLTKREGWTGRITSAQGLDNMDWEKQDPYEKDCSPSTLPSKFG